MLRKSAGFHLPCTYLAPTWTIVNTWSTPISTTGSASPTRRGSLTSRLAEINAGRAAGLHSKGFAQFVLAEGNVHHRALIATDLVRNEAGRGGEDGEMSGTSHRIEVNQGIGRSALHRLQGTQVARLPRALEH